jgi:dihydroanticapsin dehydrogenase
MGSSIEKYGKVDILFNNAGVMQEQVHLADLSEKEWDRVISINLKGAFLMSKYAIPRMLSQGGGVIISTASVTAMVGLAKGAAYAASKGGLVCLTRTIALEYGKGNIRANCICPGYVRTALTGAMVRGDSEKEQRIVKSQPISRAAYPEEIARAALYLASDDSSFITGSSLVIDGGATSQ